MNRPYFKRNLTLLVAIVTLLLGASSPGIAAEATSTVSGRIVDVQGTPVAGLTIGVQPLTIVDGKVQRGHAPAIKSKTDHAGHFSITNTVPVPVQLVAPPHRAAPYRILSIKIGAVTAYNYQTSYFGEVTFVIKPGAHIENVEIKVKPRAYIRGQVLLADGTPLANAHIQLNVSYRQLDGMGEGAGSSSAETDDEGYFVKYLKRSGRPGRYTVTVKYRVLSATAEPFILQEDEKKDDMVFTFNSELVPIDSPNRGVEMASESSSVPLPAGGVWVVNPANGHAYKSIRCMSWDDANTRAVAEKAHLVAINDGTEQKWLSKTFGAREYWIGLTDFAKEGEWQWTSGEPVTYANWALHEPMDAARGDEDYVLMRGDGKWFDVGPGSAEWRFTRMAIIEKDNPPAKTPVKKK